MALYTSRPTEFTGIKAHDFSAEINNVIPAPAVQDDIAVLDYLKLKVTGAATTPVLKTTGNGVELMSWPLADGGEIELRPKRGLRLPPNDGLKLIGHAASAVAHGMIEFHYERPGTAE
jgi:hypothetical protein